jgi:DNA-binding winged helix-turn-helix (wHTH) protein
LPDRRQIRWLFGPFELTPDRGRLSSGGAEIALTAKSFEVLAHLIRHRERVVSKNEILATVWSDVAVSDAALASAIRDLRRALADTGGKSRFVATLRGRGFRFVHEVREVPDEVDETRSSTWEAAAVHFERALRALEMIDVSRGVAHGSPGVRAPRERGELIVALARARWAAGAADEARKAFLDAARVARSAADAEILAQAALGFAGRTDVTPGVNHEAAALLEEALEALADFDSMLRAELLARLGTELYYDEDLSRSDRLTQEALAMAERIGDPAVIAYASNARHFACERPEFPPEERLPLTDRVLSLIGDGPPSDVLALALHGRMVDLLELGDGAAFEEAFGRYEKAAKTLGQPFFHWLLSLFRGTRALLAGRVEEAEELAHATLAIGLQVGTPNAQGAFAGQLFAVRREQGRLAELAPALDEVAQRHPALPIYRAALAAVLAAAGNREEARAALDDVMSRDLDDFPRDQNWIATLGTLAPAVAAAGGDRRIRQLIGLLRPYAGRIIVVGQGATTHGAVSHHVGVLHAALGEYETAERHFDDAEALYERARAPLWVTLTRRARAQNP